MSYTENLEHTSTRQINKEFFTRIAELSFAQKKGVLFPGVLPGDSWWGCAARLSNPDFRELKNHDDDFVDDDRK